MIIFAFIGATTGQTVHYLGLVEGEFLIQSIIEGIIAGTIITAWEWKQDKKKSLISERPKKLSEESILYPLQSLQLF